VRRKVSAGLVTATPLTYAGPSMLRGLAVAEALAVVPPGAGEVGSSVVLLPLP
jgi:molybdopterin molybdotransferase